jgi:outer membrane protein assembly factor BamB/tetratricopeptide (TPR) repeat protein
LFLADLALTEGNLLFSRFEEALEANERVLDLVEPQLPAWQNVAHAERASALLGLGRTDEASESITRALEMTPPGANGWRWRTRCQAIQLEIKARAGKGWDQREADDLADLLLQSEFYGWAAEMLCVIAEQGKSRGAAAEGMALAHQIGNPMLAARAASAGKLWAEPSAAPVIKSIRAMEDEIPESWRESWLAIPAVEQALAAPEPSAEETDDRTREILDAAMRRAGLAGADVMLSPAQRRNRGLVRRRVPRRRSQLVAAAIGVVLLAGATSLAVAQLQEEPEPVAAAPVTLPPEELSLEETQIPVPASIGAIDGTALPGGGHGRTGFFDADGPRTVDGYYWIYQTADRIEATPAAYGRNLLVGSTDQNFYALDQTTGRVTWELPTSGDIAASPALGSASVGEGGTQQLVVFVSDDGIVRARDTLVETADQLWQTPEPIGRALRSSPIVIEDRVFVASIDGVVRALDLFTGDEIWRYPAADAETPTLGAITAALAFNDGILYVATHEGTLHLIDIEGQQVCQAQLSGDIVVSPIVSGDTVYVGTRANLIHMLPVGQCEVPVTQTRQLLTEVPVVVAPAIVENVMYQPSLTFLYKIDLDLATDADPDNHYMWRANTVDADSTISSAPVVANDTVYFGTQSGTVYAVDAETGEQLWTWRTGNPVRASPVVVDGVVFIASTDGNVYAVGPKD